MDAPNTEQKQVRTISPQTIVIIAILIALFCPLALQIYDYGSTMFSDFSIIAMIWVYQSSQWMGPFGSLMIDPLMLFQSLPFTFLRLVFGYMLYRLYCGKTTQKRVLLTGIVMELFLPVFYLMTYLPMLVMYPGWYTIPVLLPIPILLLYGVVIVKGFPPPQDKLWIETEKTEYWWEQTKKETDNPQEIEDSGSQTEDEWLKEG